MHFESLPHISHFVSDNIWMWIYYKYIQVHQSTTSVQGEQNAWSRAKILLDKIISVDDNADPGRLRFWIQSFNIWFKSML